MLQPTQAGADDTGGVELEWLENPVVLFREGHQTLRGASATLGPDAQPPEVPYQPEVPSENNESIQIPVRRRREPSWLQDYVRAVVVYPTWPFTLVGTIAY